MIKFRQKEFSEADAMRPFFVKLQREIRERRAPFVQVISKNEMLPILSGNNVIIEKFVLSDKLIGKDTFKMYLRFGSKVKLPEIMKLSEFEYKNKSLLGGSRIDIDLSSGSNNGNNGGGNNNSNNQQKKKNKGNNKFPQQKQYSLFNPKLNGLSFTLSRDVKESLGEVILYDKKSRIAVLEFKNISDAIKALNILPLGLNYKLYLLDA